mmetsp:Transcript_588/g.1160  ORF Transcript_588/g.1160 Transcript_588/m.1160 type:complete len:117 (+) Transcript_588:194-544(+)
MASNHKYPFHWHRSRHFVVLLLLSLIDPNLSLRSVSSLQFGAATYNNLNRPIGIGHKTTRRILPLTNSMSRSSPSRHSSALSAKSGADAKIAQNQFVTNKRYPFRKKAGLHWKRHL